MDSKRKVFPAARLVLLVVMLSGLIASPVLGQQPDKAKVLIGFNHQPGAAEQALVHRFGGSIKYTYHLIPAIAATVPEPAIAGLRANPNVTHVELDGEVYALDVELDNSWGVKRIGAGTVHDGGNTGGGVRVAVIDTGIDYTHPDLNVNYVGGWDFVNNDADPLDDAGHGTHVAGTIAAVDDGAGVVGVAPEADLYALKVLGANGSGSFSDVILALQWAVDNKIQVTNNSYGSSVDPGDSLNDAFDEAYYTHGILNVCSAGNTGNPPARGDNVGYPARYASCIAVAATDSSDNRARFSSTGPDVELAAPGVLIYSTVPGGFYATYSGTSMASPHVAGTAALVIAGGISDENGDGWINDEVRERLIDTADELGDPGRDVKYGYGLVDADEAAVLPGPVNDPPAVSIDSPDDGSTFGSEASIFFAGTASDTEDGDLTASLVWTSSIDGQIGVGAEGTFFAILSDGNHTITASVTDSGDKTGSASAYITVGTVPSQPTMQVSAIGMTSKTAGRNFFVYTTVTIVDEQDIGVSGAVVDITMALPGGSTAPSSGLTGSDGTVTFSLKSGQTGIYTSTVTNVSHDSFTYLPGDPTSGSITVP